jgi:hypothetical protein
MARRLTVCGNDPSLPLAKAPSEGSPGGDTPVVLNITENEYADLNPQCRLRGLHQTGGHPNERTAGCGGGAVVATCHPNLWKSRMFNSPMPSQPGWHCHREYRLNVQGRRLAILEERDRIGMDLHDGIIQSIYAVGLTLEHARLLLKSLRFCLLPYRTGNH